jgi:adenosine 3'-phospho 5'-phosphosulfate transporter B2
MQPYGEEGEHFKYSVFLVLNNRCVSMVIAIVVLLVKQAPVKPAAPLLAYAAVSVSNVIATTCQYEALRYVSFPVQTLGKCAKMIPVMIWGRLMIGRRYGLGDYLVAAAVTSGATMFMLGGEVSSTAAKHQKSGDSTSLYGCLLMLGYLGCDGFTSTLQDKLFKGYSMETFNQMLWVTGCSAAISVVWLLGGAQHARPWARERQWTHTQPCRFKHGRGSRLCVPPPRLPDGHLVAKPQQRNRPAVHPEHH